MRDGSAVIGQVAWVVRDIEQAMQHWTGTLGVGPFFLVPHLKLEHFLVDGEPSPVELSIAIAYSGSMQIELIQQHNDAPSMYREALEAGLSGQHHVAVFTRAYDAELRKLLDAGHAIGQSGRVIGENRFAYLRTGRIPGTILELVEIDDTAAATFEAFEAAARTWDGRDPVRRVSV